jgi:hypothetical protein
MRRDFRLINCGKGRVDGVCTNNDDIDMSSRVTAVPRKICATQRHQHLAKHCLTAGDALGRVLHGDQDGLAA